MLDTLNLRLEKIPLSETPYFSSAFLDYLVGNSKLKDFVGAFPNLESFGDLIENRNFPKENRPELVRVLKEQYSGLVLSGKLTQNITALKQHDCFTVTTGHQLNIFTGPVYFIYKIVSTIRISTILKEHYPQYDFVPVYWMASEDHDFAEINHFNLFGKEYSWNTPQKGAVGRFDPNGISEILEQLKDCPDFFRDAYTNFKTLADATRSIVNHLFGDLGLVVVDGDHPDLKRMFAPIVKDELLNQSTFQNVLESTEALRKNGYKTLVTPREINLFYLKGEIRERIVKKEARYEVLNTDLTFSEQEILKQVEEHPEYFSPNVVTRTLYQEIILPNLAYVGGPGELNYWMQFKSSFDHYGIPFPLLIPRNNVLVVNKAQSKKFNKLELSSSDLFLSPNELKSTFVARNAKSSLDLESEKDHIGKIFEEIIEKIKMIDGSLTGYIKAEESKALKNLSQIEKRLQKAEERNQEMAINQLMGIKDKLFPNGSLQERHQNFLNFYVNNPQFIEDLMEHLDPFDFQFHVLFEEG